MCSEFCLSKMVQCVLLERYDDNKAQDQLSPKDTQIKEFYGETLSALSALCALLLRDIVYLAPLSRQKFHRILNDLSWTGCWYEEIRYTQLTLFFNDEYDVKWMKKDAHGTWNMDSPRGMARSEASDYKVNSWHKISWITRELICLYSKSSCVSK